MTHSYSFLDKAWPPVSLEDANKAVPDLCKQVWKWNCSKRMTSKFDFIFDVYCAEASGDFLVTEPPITSCPFTLSTEPYLCVKTCRPFPPGRREVGKNNDHPQLLPPISIDGGTASVDVRREGERYLSCELVFRPLLRSLLMNLPVFVHDKPKGPDTSSRFIGVIFGMLREGLVSSCLHQRLTKRNQSVCFLLLLTTFLCWRRLYPSLQELVRWLRDRAREYIPRCAYPQARIPHQSAESVVRQPRHKPLGPYQTLPASLPSLPSSSTHIEGTADRIPWTPSHRIPLLKGRPLPPLSATPAGLADHLPDFGNHDN